MEEGSYKLCYPSATKKLMMDDACQQMLYYYKIPAEPGLVVLACHPSYSRTFEAGGWQVQGRP